MIESFPLTISTFYQAPNKKLNFHASILMTAKAHHFVAVKADTQHRRGTPVPFTLYKDNLPKTFRFQIKKMSVALTVVEVVVWKCRNITTTTTTVAAAT